MLDSNFVSSYPYNQDLTYAYHKAQKHIWNGREVLANLCHRFGQPKLSEAKLEALKPILALMVWGEYAAWQTSAMLIAELETPDAKLAATAQTHDEARHFYVLCDYVTLLGIPLEDIPMTTVHAGLQTLSKTQGVAKKLLGMNLMVEPVAICLFQEIINAEVEPILCELLGLFIKDEARHIALGVQQLPKIINTMSLPAIAELAVWQTFLLKKEIDGLFILYEDLQDIGVDAEELFRNAESYQIKVATETMDNLGWNIPVANAIKELTQSYFRLKRTKWI